MTFAELIARAEKNPRLTFHRVENGKASQWFIWFDKHNANQLCMGPKSDGLERVECKPNDYAVPIALFLHDLITDEWQEWRGIVKS